MDNDKKSSLMLIVINLIQAYLKRLFDIIELASLEAKLAVRTFFSLIILFFVVLILLFSSWLSLLYVSFFYIISLHHTPLFAASMISLINLGMLAICCLFIWRMKRNLFFPATRKQLYGVNLADKELQHVQSKTTN